MKKLSMLTALAAVILTSCSKDELVTVNGIIRGYVMDYYYTEYLSGATIEYWSNGEQLSTTSDTSGYFSITGLAPGEYYLKVSHEGYLTKQIYAWIEPLYNSTQLKKGGKVDYVESVDANLPELNCTVRGTVRKTVGPNSLVMPAAGFEVVLQTDWDYIPRIFTTTTNSNGNFILENVPASYLNIYVHTQSDADNYYQYGYSTSFYLHPGNEYVINPTVNRSDAGIMLVSTSLDAGNGVYREDVPVDENIVLRFNINVSEEETLNLGSITLSGVVFDPGTDFTFSGNQVTINPPSNLTASTDYTLYFQVYSTIPGDNTSATIHFHTAP